MADRQRPSPAAREDTAPRVLVVDDDRSVGVALALVLGEQGYDVLAAPTGFDALSILEEYGPAVVVLDWVMPVVDGATFLRAMREEYRRATPVLVMTAVRGRREEALAAGADDYLEKPFALDDLLARINALIHRGPARGGTPLPAD
jgi:DNA-binding response OmpR family regulator